MISKTLYLVSADHRVPKYAFADTLVTVAEMYDGFFATHPLLGCGKTYSTPRDAILCLFQDHACFNISYKKEEDLQS